MWDEILPFRNPILLVTLNLLIRISYLSMTQSDAKTLTRRSRLGFRCIFARSSRTIRYTRACFGMTKQRTALIIILDNRSVDGTHGIKSSLMHNTSKSPRPQLESKRTPQNKCKSILKSLGSCSAVLFFSLAKKAAGLVQ